MSHAITTTAESLARRQFRPRRVYFVFGFAVGVAGLVSVGWMAPLALLFAVPLFGVVAAIAAFSNAGVIVSREGIEWYALIPRWRFRKVPWHAVRGARRNFFGRGGVVYLTVDDGRYEPWVWGTPRTGRQSVIEIWLRTVVRGEELLPAIEEWLPRRDAETGAMAVRAADTETW